MTRARPAAVLGNTSQSELGSDLNDSDDLDWSSLVSAAARAIQGTASSSSPAAVAAVAAAAGLVEVVDADAEDDAEPLDDDVGDADGEDDDADGEDADDDDRVQVPTRDQPETQDSLTSWIDDVTEKLRIEAENAALTQGCVPIPTKLSSKSLLITFDELDERVCPGGRRTRPSATSSGCRCAWNSWNSTSARWRRGCAARRIAARRSRPRYGGCATTTSGSRASRRRPPSS